MRALYLGLITLSLFGLAVIFGIAIAFAMRGDAAPLVLLTFVVGMMGWMLGLGDRES